MKRLQQLFASVVLTLLISISAFAGDGVIITMSTEPPPPIASNVAAEAEGIILPWLTSNDSGTEVALSLLQGVLALF